MSTNSFRRTAVQSFQIGVVAAALFAAAGPAVGADWPAWRGPTGNGVAEEKNLPTRWSATENIKWKVELPDRGNSTPIVWKDKIFLTQAIEKEGQRTLMCLDRRDGRVLWQKGVVYKEPEETHQTNPYCSASPVTDGTRVVAFYGSAGLVCYDMEGRELWKRELGKLKHGWGWAASPILHGDLCILPFGPGESNFLLAVDKTTGKDVWRLEVPEVKPEKRTDGFASNPKNGYVGSWSTPQVIKANGREELIMSYAEKINGYEPRTGRLLWTCGGLSPLVYTSPVYGEDTVVAMGGFQGTAVAVKPGGEGDVGQTRKIWQAPSKKNRIGSGVVKGGYFYLLTMPGIAECLDMKTGRIVWEERLKGPGANSESWSSAILVGDNVYAMNQSADVTIFKASPKFEVVGVNSVGGELSNSSPAVSDGEIFIRTHKHLWCVAQTGKPTAALGTGRQ